jgi:MarR family transcriptional regulator for hemolysin
MEDADERFSSALHNTARAWRLAVDRRLKYLGVTQASWMTIAVITSARTPLSQSELANRLAVEGATMVSMVDRLVKSGLANRESSLTDRRVKRVRLTNAGDKLYAKVRREAAAVRQQLLANIDRPKLRISAEVLEELQRILETLA